MNKLEPNGLHIGVLSDIHLEFGQRKLVFPDKIDILVLAGDIHYQPKKTREFFELLRDSTSAPIIYVLGNHEYYKQNFPDILDNYRNQVSKVSHTYLLEKDVQIIKGIRFLGTTLWSDLSSPTDAMVIKHSISDFRLVIDSETGYPMLPDRMTEEHIKCKEWLTQQLDTKFNGPTVVVTHFVPSLQLIPDFYRGSDLNPYFYVNLDDLIYKFSPEMWIYGHSHADVILKINTTAMVSNQAKYPHEGGTTVHIKTRILKCPKGSRQPDKLTLNHLD